MTDAPRHLRDRDFTLWLVAILKGGCRKSTTAMMLAFALARRGVDVLVVDADAGTQGVTDWSSRVYASGEELPFDVHQWSPRLGLLVPFVQQAQRDTGAQVVIVDVGGEAPEVIKQAVLIADLVITPVGAEQAELGRVEPTASLVKPERKPMAVLLNRVPVPRAGAAAAARDALAGDGYHVLDTEIGQNGTLYAHCWGTVPDELGAYEKLATELQKEAA